MIETTTGFDTIQQGHEFETVHHFYLYKKYWDSDNSEYRWENGENIDDYIIKKGKIRKSMDKILGEWKLHNLDIVVKNPYREWADDGEVWDGYEIATSIIIIYSGFIDSDNEEHIICSFKGIITKGGIEEDFENKKAKIHIRGYSDILNLYSAEDLADNQKTGENIGTGDDAETEFTTSENGVGIIHSVYIDGNLQQKGVDYTISDLNLKNTPAKITFVVAVPDGDDVTIDYTFWYQDKAISYIIDKLLIHAGITNHTIQEIAIPTSWVQTLEADFNAGTVEGTMLVDTNQLKVAINKQTVGTSSYYFDGTGIQSYQVNFISDKTLNVSEVSFYSTNRSTVNLVTLQADVGGSPSGIALESKSNISIADGWNTLTGWTVQLTSGNTYWLVIYVNNSGYIYYNAGNGKLLFAIKYSNTPSFMSQTLDATITLDNWYSQEYNSSSLGNYTFYTMSKAADADWPANFVAADWDEVINGVIQSSVQRYLRVAVVVDYTPTYNDGTEDILIYDFTIKYIDSADVLAINLVKLEELTILDAIRKYASTNDYMFGFKYVNEEVNNDPGAGELSHSGMTVFDATKCIDDSVVSGAAWRAQSIGPYIQIDFTSQRFMKKIRMYDGRGWDAHGAGEGDDEWFDCRYDIQIANKDGNYTSIGILTASSSGWNEIEFSRPYYISSMRIVVLDWGTGWDGILGYELEFYDWVDYRFIFVNKEIDTSIQKTLKGIVKIKNHGIDWKRVKTLIKASYGDYELKQSPETESESSPHAIDKFGVRKLSLDFSDIFTNDDEVVVQNILDVFYNKFATTTAKKKVTIYTKPYFQMQLSDLVKPLYSRYNNRAITYNNHNYGKLLYGAFHNPNNTEMRIYEIVHDLENRKNGFMEITLGD